MTLAATEIRSPIAKESFTYNKVRAGTHLLCIDSALRLDELEVGGALGSPLGAVTRGVFVTLPLSGGVPQGTEVTVFVRGAGEVERPSLAFEEGQLISVPELSGLGALPKQRFDVERFIGPERTFPLGRFDATCRKHPIPGECSRPFRYGGLVATYSFQRAVLSHWAEMERAVADALVSKRVALCEQ